MPPRRPRTNHLPQNVLPPIGSFFTLLDLKQSSGLARFLRRDVRSKPPVLLPDEMYSKLSGQLYNIVLSSAIHLLDESNDPRTVLAIMDVVDLYFDGPIYLDNSPEELLSLFFYVVRVLTFMMDPNAYLMVGSRHLAPSVLNIIANVSRTASHAMIRENEMDKSPGE
jgi:hypothetical protein